MGEEHINENRALKKPGIGETGILYSLVVVLFLFIGSRVQSREIYSGILITEFCLVMLPALLFLAIRRYNIKKVLRLNKVSILNLFLVLCIMVFALPAVGILNLANLWIIRNIFGRVAVVQPPVAAGFSGLMVSVLAIGVSAGICEEILFRGVILRSFERLGMVKAILISSLLFGLMHIDFQKLLGTFLLGALIGFIVYRTDSLFAGMFAHFANNTIAVMITYGATKLADLAKTSGISGVYEADDIFAGFSDIPAPQLIAAIIVWGMIFFACISILTGLIIALIRTTSEKAEARHEESGKGAARGMLWFLPGLALISFMYVVNGLLLKGTSINAVDSILRLMGIR